MGYYRAGFNVVGVDVKMQKHYPFPFVQGDALNPPVKLSAFDAIHASPPCQAHTALKAMWNAKEHADLVDPARQLLRSTGLPYVIENVPGAPLLNATVLCGTAFGLGVDDAELRRHRLFECSFLLMVPTCRHYTRDRVIGVYGGHGRDRRRIRPATVGVYGGAGGRSNRDGTQQFSMAERSVAMGIDWMTGAELSQAIPPAYTEFIGRQLILQVTG